jgi:hypothetical protein
VVLKPFQHEPIESLSHVEALMLGAGLELLHVHDGHAVATIVCLRDAQFEATKLDVIARRPAGLCYLIVVVSLG